MTSAPAPQARPDLDAALTALFASPPPNPAFVERLEARLRSAAMAPRAALPASARWTRRQRWAVGALGLALVLALALAIVGPRRVLAEFQRLLGYVPGIGFVDLDAARVLTAPVQVSRDGVTLRVMQLLAQPDRTLVVFEADGLPAYDPRHVSETLERSYTAELLLPDGSRLPGTGQSLARGGQSASGSLRFSLLPPDVYQVALLLPRLPYVVPGDAPEGWEVPLTLRLATGEFVAEVFPQLYAPGEAHDTHQGITLSVLAVAHSPDATALRLQAQWSDPAWRFGFFTAGQELRLRDDLGHVYGPPARPGPAVVQEAVEVAATSPPPGETVTPDPGLFHYEIDQNFASLSPSATRLSLQIDAVTFDVPAQTEFDVDLGAQPQVGDSYPLDVSLDVAGLPVRITGARLERKAVAEVPVETWLRFDIDTSPAADGRQVQGLGLYLGFDTPYFDGASSGYEFASGRLEAALRFKPDKPLPSGPLHIHIGGATLSVPGPWLLAWAVPGRAGPAQAPVTIHPAPIAQTHGGLTLRAEAVTLTDRLTAVQLALAGVPPGMAFRQASCWLPERRASDCWLEDDRGHRYADPGVTWQSAQPLADTLIFEAAQPLAQRMTLHVPAVEVAVDGAAGFDVTVPPDAVSLPLNQPWPVDIPVQVAGQSLRFAEARLVETGSVPQLLLKTGPLEVPHDRWLTGLRLAGITGPNGQPLDLALALSSAGRDPFNLDRDYAAIVLIPVIDPESQAIRPGTYHVELAGLTLAIRGPWEMRWRID